jgi:RNA polymerase sigma-70 factor, ECF subfamily
MPMTPQEIYEQTLVVRCQIGDESACRELLARYGPRLLVFTRKMLNAFPEQVEDVTQEIWMSIFRGLPTLRDVGKFHSWAFRVARDRIYREYRRRKVPAVNLQEAELDALPDVDEFKTAADSEELQHCLGAISPEHREALMLRFFEDMSYEEMARVTGGSLGTIRSRIHYAKAALRNAWKEQTS